jgi:hypothetical protein
VPDFTRVGRAEPVSGSSLDESAGLEVRMVSNGGRRDGGSDPDDESDVGRDRSRSPARLNTVALVIQVLVLIVALIRVAIDVLGH